MDETKSEGGRKRGRGAATSRQILDVSAEFFAQNGYDGVSVRAIAQKVGIKESSIYNHFKSKSDILETLYDEFIRLVPGTRPSDEEIDRMLMMMEPAEIFKNILFHVGKSVNGTLANTAMIINHEKFRSPRAAEMYYRYVVNEPAEYYERLIDKMIVRGMVKPVDSKMFAQQYNYISIVLTKEYLMAKYGLADVYSVVGYMVKTLTFFCELMKKDSGAEHEEKEEGKVTT